MEGPHEAVARQAAADFRKRIASENASLNSGVDLKAFAKFDRLRAKVEEAEAEAEALRRLVERSPALDPYVESRGEEMAVGIERAAAFLQSSSRGGAAMAKVYTSGGGSRIPGLPEVLAERLGVPVERANPVQNIKVRDGVFETMAVDEVVPLLMLPVGLALRAA